MEVRSVGKCRRKMNIYDNTWRCKCTFIFDVCEWMFYVSLIPTYDISDLIYYSMMTLVSYTYKKLTKQKNNNSSNPQYRSFDN